MKIVVEGVGPLLPSGFSGSDRAPRSSLAMTGVHVQCRGQRRPGLRGSPIPLLTVDGPMVSNTFYTIRRQHRCRYRGWRLHRVHHYAAASELAEDKRALEDL